MTAAAPLPAADPSAFSAAVAKYLPAEPIVGDGRVFRAVRVSQKEFWRPPALTGQTTAPRHSSKVGAPIL